MCAAGALAAQIAVLAVVPPGWQLAASTLMTALTLTALAVILIHVRPRPQPRRDDVHFGLPGDADVPSPKMHTAYELARRGVPAVWIAQHCDLPQALAELVIADARAEGDDQ